MRVSLAPTTSACGTYRVSGSGAVQSVTALQFFRITSAAQNKGGQGEAPWSSARLVFQAAVAFARECGGNASSTASRSTVRAAREPQSEMKSLHAPHCFREGASIVPVGSLIAEDERMATNFPVVTNKVRRSPVH